jgi:phenylpropionate dioxygenase-like ring-hydroxylating dioxygenase large terminal subunit
VTRPDSASELLDQIAEYGKPGSVDGIALPPSAYRDQRLFELERERIFHRSWLCVGRAESFAAPGDYLALTIAGEPVLVIRGGDGELRALSNVCRHRLHPLVAEGAGSNSRLICPYHLWAYRLDGQLAGAPCMSDVAGFDRAAVGLPSFRVEEWLGFVFVNLDAEAAPLHTRIVGAEASLRNHYMGESVTIARYQKPWPGNWKLAVENAYEGYHHMGLHAKSVEPFIPARQTYVVETHEYWARYGGPILPDVAPKYGVRYDYPTRLTADDRAVWNTVTIFPSFAVNVVGDLVNWLSWIPVDVDRTDTVTGFLLPPAALAAEKDQEQFLAAAQQAMNVINAEDEQATAALQRGAASKFAERGRLSPQEGVLSALHRFLARQLTGG